MWAVASPSLDAAGLKSPEEKTAFELLKASGDVLVLTVRAVLEGLARSALAQREGSAPEATLRSALERLESPASAGALLDRLTLSYAILTAVAPALEAASAEDDSHARQVHDLLVAVGQARSALFSAEP